ncbi:MAG: hypothetical protein R6V05_00975 [Candidatus Brocadiia bacterium]
MSSSPREPLWRSRKVLLVVTFVAAAAAFLGPLVAYDLWWHLRAGEIILSEGAVPQADPFSYTAAGAPWVYHSWLSGVVLHLVHRAAGLAGIVGLRVALITLALMIAWVTARRRGVSAALASVLVLVACLQLRVRALARPYLFSFVLFTSFAWLLWRCCGQQDADDESPASLAAYLWGGRGRLLALPFLTVLWANLHAGFLSGILLLGCFGVGEMVRLGTGRGGPYLRRLLREPCGARFRAMFLAGVLCLGASLVTPHGPGALLYSFRLLSEVQLLGQIKEWQPMPLAGHYAVFWGVAALGGVIMLRSLWFAARGGRLRGEAGVYVTDLLLFGGFALLAIQSRRHLAWVLLLTPALLGRHLPVERGGSVERPTRRRLYAAAVYVLAAGVGVWPLARAWPPRPEPSQEVTPVGACDFIESQRLDYRFYNTYEWGGYLIYRFWPAMRVFIDGRCLVYGDELIGQALRVERGGEGWRQVLDRWGVQMLAVRYRKRPADHLFEDGRWRCVYWDDLAVVALRDDVLETERPDLPTFQATNPALMARNLREADPEQMLRETEHVLARDGDCWTALAMRAHALVRLAAQGGEEAQKLAEEAFLTARRAVRLEAEQPEPWQALAEAAGALGRDELAAEARLQAARRGVGPASLGLRSLGGVGSPDKARPDAAPTP